jgi:hypothetical protein
MARIDPKQTLAGSQIAGDVRQGTRLSLLEASESSRELSRSEA